MCRDLRRVDFSRVGGLAEVSALLNRSPQAISGWFKAAGASTPPPLFRTAAGAFWDLAEWVAWGEANPQRVGPGFTGRLD